MMTYVRTVGLTLVIATWVGAAGCEQQMRVGERSDGSGGDAWTAEIGTESGDGGGDDAGGLSDVSVPDTPRHRAAIALLETLCEVAYECPKANGILQMGTTGFGSVGACKRTARSHPRAFYDAGYSTFANVLLSDRTQPDLSVIDQCLSAMKREFCSNERSIGPDDVEACERFFGGVQNDGELCLTDFECSGDLRCTYGESDTCQGMCTAPETPGGPSCGDMRCEGDEYCESDAQGPTCRARKSEGESCSEWGECGEGTACTVEAGSEVTGTCAAYGSQKDGEKCGSGFGLCELGTTCVSGTCKRVELGEEGKSCSGDVARLCKPSLSCVSSGENDEAVCRKLGELGDTCHGSGKPGCRPGLFCTQNEVCEEVRPVGETCIYPDQCATGNCVDGKCRPVDVCAL